MRSKLATVSGLAVFVVASTVFLDPGEEGCCAAPAATCTGSASCRACKDCSKCGYCNGGGSCGVCSGGEPEKKSPPARTLAPYEAETERLRESQEKARAEEKARLEDAGRQAGRLQEQVERSTRAEAERAAFAAKVDRIYPNARSALINARNRGNGAPVSARKAAVAREVAKAAAKLCRDYQITRAELDRIVAAGEAGDGTAARKAAVAGKAAAKARANAESRAGLDAIGKQLDRAARALPGGPGGPPTLPPANTAPIR